MDPTTFKLAFCSHYFQPVAISFTANNYNPGYGGSITLSWNVTNSAAVSISSIGAVDPTGSSVKSSGGTVTYQLTATGIDGLTYFASVTIYWGAYVPPPPPAYGEPGWCTRERMMQDLC